MNRDMAQTVSDSTSSLEPRIVAQKQDIVYVKNPGADWGLNRALHFARDDLTGCILCLEESQAIALLLDNSEGRTLQSEQTIDQAEDGLRVSLGWGKAQTVRGTSFGKEQENSR